MDYQCYRLSDIPADRTDESVLMPEERAMPPQRRVARILLRQELARRTGAAAADIRISYNEHGKPIADGIHFNLSHSGDWLCMAFHHAPIGIDVQQQKASAKLLQLAPRIMAEAQLQRFREQGCRREDFFTCWAIAEALVKWRGDTIWHATQYPFLLYPERVVPLFSDSITIRLFRPAKGCYGAIAYQKQPD